MLPQPNLSFTLPSIYDNTKLDCRVYHPPCFSQPSGARDIPWRQHAAVVSHPYAPLGGNFDDHIVHLVASTLLQHGFVVATFNFRGASSDGRTSWTSKPERFDYMSVVGFLVYYVHHLHLPPDSPVTANDDAFTPTLLLAGYSYGAMVTLQLPPLESFLTQFASPATHTAMADIRLRAQHLAEQQVRITSAPPSSPRKSLGMRIGGDEDTLPQKPSKKFRAHSPDREERIRKGVKDVLARTKLIHRKRDHSNTEHSEEIGHEPCLESIGNLIRFRIAYLLVSPPLGLVTNLATMSFSNPLSSWSRRRKRGPSPARNHERDTKQEEVEAEAETKLVKNATMVIYGDQDGFLAVKKMRDWVFRLGNHEGRRFRHLEVSGAGHFWVEDGVMYKLEEAVSSFAADLGGS
ncbi:Alpha/Beta hydrolase protein [Hypomontagnella monticulosa]|nr:Alpha/Beta hydrolase protein [Hypomontagnella monticulosa]